MKRRLILFLFILIASPAWSESIFPYKYQEAKLENGLKVILVPIDNAGLVSYTTVVNVGSRHEIEPGHTGFAHFFEHMMFRGTKKYPADKYSEILLEIGGDQNAFTGEDFTVYYVHFPRRFLEKVVDIESDRFMNLDYSLSAFQTEAKAVLGEYNKNFANPFFQLEEKLNEIAFEKSTYEHTAMGFLKDIQDMPNQFDYSRVFFTRFYRPENCIIIVSGKFNPEEALSLIKKYYSAWKPGDYRPEIPKEPEQTQERKAAIHYEGDTLPLLSIAYKAPAFHPASKEFAALSLLSDLAFGETSLLFQKLVLQEQKADFVSGEYIPHMDDYLFNIAARLKNIQDLSVAEQAIFETLEQMKQKPVEAKRLEDLKSNRKYSFLMSFDTSKSITNGFYRSMAPYLALIHGVAAVDQIFKTYDSITPGDIQNAAKQYFQKEKRIVVTLTGAKS
ncbi:insulinase family protein [bacterium]|nr:insulinase family protein [bacterium]